MTTLIPIGRNYETLVEEERVHSAIFTDEQVFQDEMERIFHRTWLFALHESELPKAGDFKRLQLGRYPVIATRGEDGEIHLLVNRCRHRGAQVCESNHGNTRRFQCWYHGWTYDTRGDLIGLTGPEAYDKKFDAQQHGLTRVARVDSYRGFVFASFAKDGISLSEYLGPTKPYIDIMVDASPTGELFVKPGVVNRTRYRGNWKQVGMDGYHPHYVHMSVFKIFSKRESTTGSAVGALHLEDPFADSSKSRTRGFPNGHACLDFREQRRPHADASITELRRSEEGAKYVDDMISAHGEEHARDLIAWHGDPHLGLFPNLQLIHDHVRVVIPISPGETEVLMYPVFLGGVGQSINEKRLRAHEAFYGPAAAGSPDDAEIFERTQRGLIADAEPWVQLGRGINREEVDEDGSVAACISDEITQRVQMREWKKLMCAPK